MDFILGVSQRLENIIDSGIHFRNKILRVELTTEFITTIDAITKRDGDTVTQTAIRQYGPHPTFLNEPTKEGELRARHRMFGRYGETFEKLYRLVEPYENSNLPLPEESAQKLAGFMIVYGLWKELGYYTH